MGSVNNNFLPASTGLSLGNANQRWDVSAGVLNATTIQSAGATIALTGTIALASTDTIAWRNNADSADVTLSKTGAASGTTPADTLTFSGSGIEGPFISHNSNPASAGELRLADTDIVYFRNHTNSADISALTHNSDDTVTVGDAAGSKTASLAATTSVTTPLLQSTGALQVASGGTAGLGVSINGSPGTTLGGQVSVSGGDASGGSGGGIVIQAGNGGGGGAGGAVTINGGTGSATGAIQTNTYVSKYNNIATTGQGLAPQYVTIDLTAQAAAITTTTLYGIPATGAGQYRISWNAQVTTVDAVSSTLGALTIVYTSADNVTHTITCGAQTSAGAIATTSTTNTTAAVLLGLPMLLNCKASTNITYAFAYTSNTPGQMKYDLRIKVEYLG